MKGYTRFLVPVLLMTILVVAAPSIVLADLGNPGQNIAQWLYSEVVAFFPAILAGFALWFLAQRQFTAFISFFFFTVLVAVVVYFPDSVKTVGKALWDTAWGN